MVLYWSFPLPSSVCLAFTCFNQCFLKIPDSRLERASQKVKGLLFCCGFLQTFSLCRSGAFQRRSGSIFVVGMSNTKAAGLEQFQQERLQLPTLLLPMSEVERQLLLKVPVPVGNSGSK